MPNIDLSRLFVIYQLEHKEEGAILYLSFQLHGVWKKGSQPYRVASSIYSSKDFTSLSKFLKDSIKLDSDKESLYRAYKKDSSAFIDTLESALLGRNVLLSIKKPTEKGQQTIIESIEPTETQTLQVFRGIYPFKHQRLSYRLPAFKGPKFKPDSSKLESLLKGGIDEL